MKNINKNDLTLLHTTTVEIRRVVVNHKPNEFLLKKRTPTHIIRPQADSIETSQDPKSAIHSCNPRRSTCTIVCQASMVVQDRGWNESTALGEVSVERTNERRFCTGCNSHRGRCCPCCCNRFKMSVTVRPRIAVVVVIVFGSMSSCPRFL